MRRTRTGLHRGVWTRFGAWPALLALAAVLPAGSARAVPVGVELVLAVDVSGTIDDAEFELMRGAYASAFRDPVVVGNIQAVGGAAATLVYWGDGRSVAAVDWTLLSDAASASSFADAIEGTTRDLDPSQPGLQTGGQTSVASALQTSIDLFLDNGFEGTRRVIDVGGDGSENFEVQPSIPSPLATIEVELSPTSFLTLPIDPMWGATQAARDAAVEAGIVVNGLAIRPQFFDPPNDGNEQTETLDATPVADFFAAGIGGLTPEEEALVLAALGEFEASLLAQFGLSQERLTLHEWFFREAVAGGEGSFVVVAEDFEDLTRAAASKIALEVIPEPSTALLLGLPLALAAARRWRRTRA